MMIRSALMGTVLMPHPDPAAYLTRQRAAESLTEYGYPTTTSTLATKAVRGGGPVMRKFGARVLYRWADLLEWAESKTSGPRHTTSEPINFDII